MTAVQKHAVTLMLLLSWATAQNAAGPATVQKVTAAQAGDDLRVEIILSSPVKAFADTAVHPDRILIDLPDTLCNDSVTKIEVNSNGVQRVRAAQHSSSPPIARIVLDLDQAHPYTLQSEGNRVILTVSPQVSARDASRGAMAPAISGSVIGIFRRKQQAPAQSSSNDNSAPLALPVPPPPTAPVPGATTTSTVAALPPAANTVPIKQPNSGAATPESSGGPSAFPASQIIPSQPTPSGNDAASAAGFPSGSAVSSPPSKRESASVSNNENSAPAEPAITTAPLFRRPPPLPMPMQR